jgi:hypothetical protein
MVDRVAEEERRQQAERHHQAALAIRQALAQAKATMAVQGLTLALGLEVAEEAAHQRLAGLQLTQMAQMAAQAPRLAFLVRLFPMQVAAGELGFPAQAVRVVLVVGALALLTTALAEQALPILAVALAEVAALLVLQAAPASSFFATQSLFRP